MIKRMNELKEEATALFKANNLDQAVEKYREAIAVDEYNRSFNAVVYCNIGVCLKKQNKHKDAIREFNKSIDLNPTYAKAYEKRGDCYKGLEK